MAMSRKALNLITGKRGVIDKRLVIVLLCGLAFSVLLYFAADLYIKNVKKTIDYMVQNNLFNIKSVLMVNLNFLRARRAEKNLIIYRDNEEMLYRYKDQLDSYLQDVDNSMKDLEAKKSDSSDEELLIALNKNITDYKDLIKQLVPTVTSKEDTSKTIEVMLNKINDINDMLADNVMYIYIKNSNQIASRYQDLETNFSNFKNFVRIFLLISILVGYIAAMFFVRLS